MKKINIIILLGFFIFPFVLNAQVLTDQQKTLYQNKVIKFTKMKKTGMGLTFGGIALSVAGVIVMNNSDFFDSVYPTDEQYTEWALGYLVCAVGIGATAGGITLWSIGGSKVRKYNQKLDSFSLNLNPSPRQFISLAYRF